MVLRIFYIIFKNSIAARNKYMTKLHVYANFLKHCKVRNEKNGVYVKQTKLQLISKSELIVIRL